MTLNSNITDKFLQLHLWENDEKGVFSTLLRESSENVKWVRGG